MSSSKNFRWQKIAAPPPEKKELTFGTKTRVYYYPECTWRGCEGKQIVAQITYDYVTGRAGRVSDARKYVCETHLEIWRKKHPEARELPATEY